MHVFTSSDETKRVRFHFKEAQRENLATKCLAKQPPSLVLRCEAQQGESPQHPLPLPSPDENGEEDGESTVPLSDDWAISSQD